MAWKSLEEMVAELDLAAKPDNIEGIRRELRKRIANAHPDHEGGVFKSEEDQTKFNLLRAALDYVDKVKDEAAALVPVSQLPAIIKAIRDASLAPIDSEIPKFSAQCKADSRAEFRSHHFFPRIGSGVFAAVCTFLLTFSETFKEHPVLFYLAKNFLGQATLLCLAVIAGFFFVLTWFSERRDQARIEWLTSERGRREVFEHLLQEAAMKTRPGEKPTITISQVVEVIQDTWRRIRTAPPHTWTRMHTAPPHTWRRMRTAAPHIFSLLSVRRLSPSLVENIARIHLLELEQREVVRRIPGPSLDIIYGFDPTFSINL